MCGTYCDREREAYIEKERPREGETIKFRIYPSFSDDFFMVEHVKASI